MGDYDAIVIGGGHNGMAAALYLARAGWKVIVLERNARTGGAIASAEVTLPGFVHDLYSTNCNLFVGSPVYKDFGRDLERHGLSFAHSDKPYCAAFPDGKCIRVYQDAEKTLDLLRQHSTADAEGFTLLNSHFQAFVRSLVQLYGMPMPSVQVPWTILRAIRSEGLREIIRLLRLMISSTRRLGEEYFTTPEARALVAAWGMHLDFGPDVAGGAIFPVLETFTDIQAGMSIVKGGASNLMLAMERLLLEFGGEVRTNAEVTRIVTRGGEAIGVQLADGETISAGRCVIANLSSAPLFGKLLADYPFTAQFRRDIGRYSYGPGTMMVHLALSGRPAWRAGGDTDQFAYVHIAPYVEDLALTYTHSLNGILPASPLLIVGQTSVVDPTRTAGKGEILWIQVRTLPSEIRGDALNSIKARTWDAAKEAYADRVIDKLEHYAPGLRGLIAARAVESPADLERANPNLVGGDSLAGSHHLTQNFLFRPALGWSRYRTPITRLYMCGAGTYPGAGNNALSGYLCAQQILNSQKSRIAAFRRAFPGSKAA
ncbi:MAG: NAD(P)/FAD-dependent oxidoreductase [Candidatus Binataceae bacterium]|nr:NAD(P)/FAD-dependent oxidoreductase [Candidatus Binataceae bacterium]